MMGVSLAAESQQPSVTPRALKHWFITRIIGKFFAGDRFHVHPVDIGDSVNSGLALDFWQIVHVKSFP